MTDKTDKTTSTNADDDFYDDDETMGVDISAQIAKPDDTGVAGDEVRDPKYPLEPERSDYDLKNRGTISEVEEGSGYEADNDQEANIDTPDERDGSRGNAAA